MIERIEFKDRSSVEANVHNFKRTLLMAIEAKVDDEIISTWQFESTQIKPNERVDRFVYKGNMASSRKREEWKAVIEVKDNKYECKLIKNVKIKNGYFVRATEFGLRDNFFIEYSEYILKKDLEDITTIQAPTEDISKAEALIREMPNPQIDAIERARMFAGNYYHLTEGAKGDTKVISIASHPRYHRK